MNPTIFPIILALTLLVQQAFAASDDPRFRQPTSDHTQNSYLQGTSDALVKAYKREGYHSVYLKEIKKVGGTYIVSFSVTINKVDDPVTEKDFSRLDEFFKPFITSQIELYRKQGKKISSITNSFPLPESAEGYTNDTLPTMTYIISGEDSDLFIMRVTFSERRGNFMVADFTIASVEK